MSASEELLACFVEVHQSRARRCRQDQKHSKPEKGENQGHEMIAMAETVTKSDRWKVRTSQDSAV